MTAPVPRFRVRGAVTDDATDAGAILRAAFAKAAALFPEPAGMTAAAFDVQLQTGRSFLVAEAGERLVGILRHREDEGIAWFDLLASSVPGAGRALVRAIGRHAQDAGIRLVRARVPDEDRLLDFFGRLGYLTVGREGGKGGDPAWLTVERRLPLLTVREQRRADATSIAVLTGDDPWRYEQGPRPGCFVAADGDRVVGFVAVRDRQGGTAAMTVPVLLAGYERRRLELWMIGRAVTYADTNGFHTVELPATPATDALRRDLEDAFWFHEAAEPERYVRRLRPEAIEDDLEAR